MTLFMGAVGLTVLVVLLELGLMIQAFLLTARTRRLRREVAEQRARLVTMFESDLARRRRG